MTRNTHASTMDGVYRYQRHIYDFTRKYYLFGRDTLLNRLDIPDGARVLEVGCGTGRNIIRTARKNPQALFYGYDISQAMLETATASASRSGLADRTFLTTGDAEGFDACTGFGLDGFDRVFMSYTLSMIPDWERAFENAVSQLGGNGSLHIVDFGTMHRWPVVVRRLMLAWLARFHVQPRPKLADTARMLADRHDLAINVEQLGGGYATLMVMSKAVHKTSKPVDAEKQPYSFETFQHAMQP